MKIDRRTRNVIASLLRSRFGCEPDDLHIARRRMKGGLEAGSVERIVARYRDRSGRQRSLSLVAKQMEGTAAREADVYRSVLATSGAPLAPAMFGIARGENGRTVLFLEDIRRVSSWPWGDTSASRDVLQRLAHFHELHRAAGSTLPYWDYEADLEHSAFETLEQLNAMRRSSEFSSLAAEARRPVGRLVGGLSKRRAALLRFAPFGGTTIHGDVHPGNVLVRRRHGELEPVLIDWARARAGSALEDVSSWLQSLGCWEPDARKRHDTLLKEYLRALGSEASLPTDLRAAYWVAGASNALAGALRYHCWRAMTCDKLQQRADAARFARDWLRVIVRADALSS